MFEYIDLVRYLHVIGATILLGTGAGIAFFMVMANRTQDASLIAHVSATVVVADMVFTATAAILQPVSGIILAINHGWALGSGWVLVSLLLYVFIGLFWLPVVFIQIRMRNIARIAVKENRSLNASYDRLYRIWLAFGFPAFFALLTIFWLMLFKPDINIGI